MEQIRLPVGNKSQHGESRGHLKNAGYSDPINAAPRGPFSDGDLEEITRRLEAIKAAQDYVNDTDTHDFTDCDASLVDSETSSSCLDISWEAFTMSQILSGQEKVEKFVEDVGNEYRNNIATTHQRFSDAEDDPRQLVAFKTSELCHLHEYQRQLFHLLQAAKRQHSREGNALLLYIHRNLLFQDRLATNAAYLPRLEDQCRNIKELAETKQGELKKLKEAEDVTRPSHPRHAELSRNFCYTDKCPIHRSSKGQFGYWPWKRKPIYWDHEPGNK